MECLGCLGMFSSSTHTRRLLEHSVLIDVDRRFGPQKLEELVNPKSLLRQARALRNIVSILQHVVMLQNIWIHSICLCSYIQYT